MPDKRFISLNNLSCHITDHAGSITKFMEDWDKAFISEWQSDNSIIDNECKQVVSTIIDGTIVGVLSPSYKANCSPKDGLKDLHNLYLSSKNSRLIFRLTSTSKIEFTLSIYSSSKSLTLSDLLPPIENLGFKAIDCESFVIPALFSNDNHYIYHFKLNPLSTFDGNQDQLRINVEEALDKISTGLLCVDSLSKLVALAGLNWRQVKLLKALTLYLHQTGLLYDKGYVQSILVKHHQYSKILLNMFDAKFNPDSSSAEKLSGFSDEIGKYLLHITNSSEEKILDNLFKIVIATNRTNFYKLKSYISFKFDSTKIPDLPLPKPYAEIFVYSNDFEAIHLRGGKVARGGIRWSDRSEDYRTEVLGLMKAQMTKNSVIVPVGSKGGFFVYAKPDSMSSDKYKNHVIECYKNFLRGLLDITDNIVHGKIVHPTGLVIYDELDPYLVVAADKGTATFSDHANKVSQEYDFWLGDAFASGGSAGYDHKKMAITARGAWISVQNHFKTLGIDVQKDPITVVGIGDMSGDVFGNGMLLSKSIKLVAAFNHKHIFIDPNPNPEISFEERNRLFNIPASNWSDYDSKLISSGGGVFERISKEIPISKEMKELFSIEGENITPDSLIRAIIKAKVDLIWNGGIGTYIKASTESHMDIGDKTNDKLRCNGKDIRAKVIAEGGNLGVSQLGRIEYNQNGGLINTDFIDNSAGVDCSDHEVNIKIAFASALAKGKITLEQRDKLLASMTEQVAQLVLMDNYKQTEAVALASSSSLLNTQLWGRLIDALVEEKLLDREVEFLPSPDEIKRKTSAKEHLTRPELAVLLSYSKMSIYNQLITSNILNDQYFERYLLEYFPEIMIKDFKQEIISHPLRKEIIATVITNKIINKLGGALIYSIQSTLETSVEKIILAYAVIVNIFDVDELWLDVSNSNIESKIKVEMFSEIMRLLRRGITWFIKHIELFDVNDGIQSTIDSFTQSVHDLVNIIGPMLLGEAKVKFDNRIEIYKNHKVSDTLASRVASLDNLISVFDIIDVARKTDSNHTSVAKLYFIVGERFHIDWMRKECEKQMNDSYWNRLAIQSMKEDLYEKQRLLLTKVIIMQKNCISIDDWIKLNNSQFQSFNDFIMSIKAQDTVDINMMILSNKKFELYLSKLG